MEQASSLDIKHMYLPKYHSASGILFRLCLYHKWPHQSQEKAMAPHSSTLAWRLPWTEEPGRLQSMGSLRVRHDWVTSLSLFTFMHWRRKWQPIPVFLPGESQGRGSLVGCQTSMGSHRVGHDRSDLAAAAAAYQSQNNNNNKQEKKVMWIWCLSFNLVKFHVTLGQYCSWVKFKLKPAWP